MSGAGLDREKLAKLLGLTGSPYDGEVLTAARLADAYIRQAETTWYDVLLPFEKLGIAIAGAQRLLEENEALRAQIERLLASLAGAEDWQSVSKGIIATGTVQERAQWVLDLWQAKQIYLSATERRLLAVIAEGDGELRIRQQTAFDRLITSLGERLARGIRQRGEAHCE